MTGIVLDSILMLLLVVAIGYGIRLERKLVALRVGQLAFAGAVTELNTAAGRAEAALASLRASGCSMAKKVTVWPWARCSWARSSMYDSAPPRR